MPARTRLWLIHLVFLLSGMCGLAYQAIWARWFGLGLGQEMPAVLASVAAFMAGLAFGAAILDRRVRTSRSPALWYAGLEAVIGLWAIATLVLAPLANELARQALGPVTSPGLQLAVAFGVPFAVLLPATAAMGATLPAIERFAHQLVPGQYQGGMLYAVNTVGAGAGALLCSYALLPNLGLRLTTIVCGILNLASAGVVAWLAFAGGCQRLDSGGPLRGSGGLPSEHASIGRKLLSMNRRQVGRALRCPPSPARRGLRALPGMAGSWPRSESKENGSLSRGVDMIPRRRFVLFLTGFLGIGLEVIGVRLLKMVLDNTAFTFACVLAVYLLGTGAGAAAARRIPSRFAAASRVEWLLGGLALSSLGMGWALTLTPGLNDRLIPLLGMSPAATALREILVTAWVFLPSTLLMGATFATLLDATARGSGSVGSAVAWNTAGAALAPWLVGAGFFPAWGGRWTLLAITAGYMLLRGRFLTPGSIALMAGLAITAAALPDLRLIRLHPGERLIACLEGSSDTVSVVEIPGGHRALQVNNRFTMGGTAALVAERRQAILPLLLHPGPRKALFLGSGTGITAAAATLEPDMDVDSVELLPEVVAMQAHFHPENAPGPGRLRQWTADARRYVRTTDSRYDVVVADLFHPARDGSGGLYTREHYEAIRACLAPGGMVCQWLPLHQVERPALALMVGSFKHVFPHVRGYLLRATIDTPVLGLMGTLEPILYPAGWVERRLAGRTWAESLKRVGITETVQLLGWCLFDEQDLTWVDRPDTDDRLLVNTLAARQRAGRPGGSYATFFELLREPARGPDRLLADHGDSPQLQMRLRSFRAARDAYLRGLRADQEQDAIGAKTAFLESVQASADFTTAYSHLVALAVQIFDTEPARATELLAELDRLRPESPLARELLERLARERRPELRRE